MSLHASLQHYGFTAEDDLLARPQLGTFARFDRTVHADLTGGNRRMGLATGFNQTFRLEQLIELDEFAANNELRRHHESQDRCG